jgi:hypothetical protein
VIDANLLSEDLVCFYTLDTLQVFQLPEQQPPGYSTDSIQSIVTLPVNFTHRPLVRAPVTRRDGGSIEFLFSIGQTLNKAVIGYDPNICTCDTASIRVREDIDFDTVWSLQSLRMVSVGLQDHNLLIESLPLPLSDASRRALTKRVGDTEMLRRVSFLTTLPKDASILRVEFDEWTGLIVVHWMSEEWSQSPRRYFSVFSFLDLLVQDAEVSEQSTHLVGPPSSEDPATHFADPGTI